MFTSVQRRIRELRKEQFHSEEIAQILEMEGFKTPRGYEPDVHFVVRQIGQINEKSPNRPLPKVRTFKGLESYKGQIKNGSAKSQPTEVKDVQTSFGEAGIKMEVGEDEIVLRIPKKSLLKNLVSELLQ